MKVQSPAAEGPCMILMPGVVAVGQEEATKDEKGGEKRGRMWGLIGENERAVLV